MLGCQRGLRRRVLSCPGRCPKHWARGVFCAPIEGVACPHEHCPLSPGGRGSNTETPWVMLFTGDAGGGALFSVVDASDAGGLRGWSRACVAVAAAAPAVDESLPGLWVRRGRMSSALRRDQCLNIKWDVLGYGHTESTRNLWGSTGSCGGLQSRYDSRASAVRWRMSLQRGACVKVLDGSAAFPLLLASYLWLLGDRNATVLLPAVLEQELELRFALALAPGTGLEFASRLPARRAERR